MSRSAQRTGNLKTSHDGDELDDFERRKLHQAIAEAEKALDAGFSLTPAQLWGRLKAIR